MSNSTPIPPTDSSSDRMPTSRSLLQRARNHDEDAWREMVSLYAPLVYFWCRRMNVAEQEIPDLVQDVFRAVVMGLDRFRKDRPSDTFRGWLRTVTRTKVIDCMRRACRNPTAVGGSEANWRWEHLADATQLPEEEQHAEKALFLRAIETVRPKFDPQTWQAFWQMVVDGRSAVEIAAELGIRPGTV